MVNMVKVAMIKTSHEDPTIVNESGQRMKILIIIMYKIDNNNNNRVTLNLKRLDMKIQCHFETNKYASDLSPQLERLHQLIPIWWVNP